MTAQASGATAERISRSILVVRSHRVLLDEDLAARYGVGTKVLIQAVNRNPAGFPADFLFQLSAKEWNVLRSQIVPSKPGRGGRRYAPYAFTEQGVAILASNDELAHRFGELEAHVEKRLTADDEAIAAILSAIRQLLSPSVSKTRGIGFTAALDESEK